MASIVRDDNRITAGAGLNNTDSVSVIPFYIDSVTGRVLLSMTEYAGSGTSYANAPSKRDGNRVTSLNCTFSDDTGYGMPAIDSATNYLLLTLA